MKYSAVLFDLDGTLLDTLGDLASSTNQLMRELGFPEHPVESYKLKVGNGIAELVRRALPEEKRNDGFVLPSVGRLKDIYSDRRYETTIPYEGIPEMLDRLSYEGYRLSILSNKPHDFTTSMVKELLPKWHFEYVFGSREGVPKKPDPAAALEIAEKMNLSPGEFLYLGDTGTDMKTAAAAGMFPVGVLWGFRGEEELIENGAKIVITTPVEIFNVT